MKLTRSALCLMIIHGLCACTISSSLDEGEIALAICQANSAATEYDQVGNGTTTEPFVICTPAQFARIGQDSSAFDKSFILGANLDLAGYDGSTTEKTILPIGAYDYVTAANQIPFSGSFNGNGYVISNLKMEAPSNQGVAVFGYTKDAAISNIRVENLDVTGTQYTAGLIAYNKSSDIMDVSISGTVTGTNTIAGGVVAYNDGSGMGQSSMMTRIHANVDVAGFDIVGGLIGYNSAVDGGNADVSHSSSTGDLTQSISSNTFGGLIGYNISDGGGSADISSSFNTGDITLTANGSFSGGFIGTNVSSGAGSSSAIRDCYNTGSISSPISFNSGRLGGFIGLNRCDTGGSCRIERSFNTGDVTVTAGAVNRGYIGGFIGNLYVANAGTDGVIEDCFATGSIQVISTGGYYVGGFIGGISTASSGTASIQRTYASVSITGNSLGGSVGGFSGGVAATGVSASNSYWNSTLIATGSGQAISTISGLSSIEILKQSSFVGFDFTSTWSIQEDVTMPRLLTP